MKYVLVIIIMFLAGQHYGNLTSRVKESEQRECAPAPEPERPAAHKRIVV